MLDLLLYFFILIIITIYVVRPKGNKSNFLKKHFIADSNMGFFSIGLSQVAMYISASSLIGGSGAAFKYGLSWVLLASVQIPVSFLVLGIIGKRVLQKREAVGAITIMDFISHSYRSRVVVYISSFLLVIFMSVGLIAQFIAAGKTIAVLTGYSYNLSLSVFVIILLLYTLFGGFRAVVLTDVVQLLLVTVFVLVIFFVLLHAGGGLSHITEKIASINSAYVDPTSGGRLPKAFITSFFVLVGVGLFGVPMMLTRALMIKDGKELNRAIVFSSIVLGGLIIIMHFIGFMAIAFVSRDELSSSDSVIGYLALHYLPKHISTLFLIAPLAAIMSTVDGMFLVISSTIVKNVYMDSKKDFKEHKNIKIITFTISLILALIIYLLAFNPPDLLLWLNLLSLGGVETTFFTILLFALFAKKVYSLPAICSIVVGMSYYVFSAIFKYRPYEMNHIVITLLLSLLTYYLIHIYMCKKDRYLEL